jgi:hypothetical protein
VGRSKNYTDDFWIKLIGTSFGERKILDIVGPINGKRTLYSVQCNCGYISKIRGEYIMYGPENRGKRCVKCFHKAMQKPRLCPYPENKKSVIDQIQTLNNTAIRVDELIGKIFGYRTVIGEADVSITPEGKSRVRYDVQCGCGRVDKLPLAYIMSHQFSPRCHDCVTNNIRPDVRSKDDKPKTIWASFREKLESITSLFKSQ